MRYAVAAVISLVLILASMGFVKFINAEMAIAKDFGMNLPGYMLALISTAQFLRVYWYVFLIAFLAIPLLIAAILPSPKAK
jgi:hypothetical protein